MLQGCYKCERDSIEEERANRFTAEPQRAAETAGSSSESESLTEPHWG